MLQEAEKRLRDIVTGKKAGSALAVNGSAARKLGSKQRQQVFVFTVRRPLASGTSRNCSAACTPLLGLLTADSCQFRGT